MINMQDSCFETMRNGQFQYFVQATEAARTPTSTVPEMNNVRGPGECGVSTMPVQSQLLCAASRGAKWRGMAQGRRPCCQCRRAVPGISRNALRSITHYLRAAWAATVMYMRLGIMYAHTRGEFTSGKSPSNSHIHNSNKMKYTTFYSSHPHHVSYLD